MHREVEETRRKSKMLYETLYDKAVTARQLAIRESNEAVRFLVEASVRLSMGQTGFPVRDAIQAAKEAAQHAAEWAGEAKRLETEIFGEGGI